MYLVINKYFKQFFSTEGLYILLKLLLWFLPFSVFTMVWLAKYTGGLVLLLAWKEILIMTGLATLLILMYRQKALLPEILSHTVNKLVLAYVLLTLLYFVFAPNYLEALVGLTLNTGYLAVFVIAQVVAKDRPNLYKEVINILLKTGVAVGVIAIIIHFLPMGILSSFGYDEPGVNNLGVPPAYHLTAGRDTPVRAQSTLRGPNVFGVFMLIPFSIVLYAYARKKYFSRVQQIQLGVVFIAIFLSHSRSAWLGGIALIGLMGLLVAKGYKRFVLIGASGLIALTIVGLGFTMRQNPLISAVIFHQPVHIEDSEEEFSNEGHQESVEEASSEALVKPLGYGLGAAGPASTVDGGDSKIAENYYLQITQEVGWIGIGLLIGIVVVVAKTLYRYRSKTSEVWIGLMILASVGITGLFMHTWTDETIALGTWTLIGALIGRSYTKHK